MKIQTLKGASGLGDSLYIRQVAQHLYSQDKDIFLLIMSDYPMLFKDLPSHVVKHDKGNIITYKGQNYPVKKISYCGRKMKPQTTQFEDVCIAASVPQDIPYKLDWKVKNNDLIDRIRKLAKRKDGKPIILVTAPYKPFGRDDNWGKEMTVDFKVMDSLISAKRNDYLFVQTCKNDPIYQLKHIDLNLARKTIY
jgi:hypothetical protein